MPWTASERRTGRTVRRAAALLAVLAAVTAATPPGEAAARRASGWRVRPAAPAAGSQELRAVAAVGPDDAWAVGTEGTPDGDVPLVERFDGAAWRRAAVPAGPGGLDAVLPLAADDVWAVGSRGDAADGRSGGLALRFDGRAWREVPLPAAPDGRLAHPFALAATGPADLWAVGATAGERATSPRPLAEHWDGSAWRTVEVPGPDAGGDAVLLSAAADRAGGVWAVGVGYDPDGTGRPLAEHWDGSAWRTVPVPAPADGGSTTLEAVAAFGPDDVWAAGSTGLADGPTGPYLLHWDGTDWRTETLPGEADGALHALAAADDGTLWAVGEQSAATTPGFTLRRGGGRWSYRPADPGPAGEGASLSSVAAVPGGTAVAVGSTLPQQQDAWHAVIEDYLP